MKICGKCPGKVCLSALLVVLALLLLVRMVLPTGVQFFINRKLPAMLGVDVSVRDIDISVLRGRVELRSLVLKQPREFKRYGSDAFVEIPVASANVGMMSLFASTIVVEDVLVKDAEIRIVKDINGMLTTDSLGTAPVPPVPATLPMQESTEPESKAGAKPGKAILVKRLLVENSDIFFVDESLGDKPVLVELTDVNLQIEDLLVSPGRSVSGREPAIAELTARLIHRPYPDALLGLYARIGVLGEEVPELNAALRIVGVELPHFASLVPPGVAGALGGDCLDVSGDLALGPQLLDVRAKVMSRGNTLPLNVGGTPLAPAVDRSGLLFAVAGRLGGSVGNVAGAVGKSGVKVAGAAIEGVGAAGKGVFKTAGTFGKGLFNAAKGVATADFKGAGSGLKEATVGTLGEAIGAVSDTAGSVSENVGEAGGALSGAEQEEAWRREKQKRWSVAWPAAQQAVLNAPFPPVRGWGVGDTPAAEPEPEPVAEGSNAVTTVEQAEVQAGPVSVTQE